MTEFNVGPGQKATITVRDGHILIEAKMVGDGQVWALASKVEIDGNKVSWVLDEQPADWVVVESDRTDPANAAVYGPFSHDAAWDHVRDWAAADGHGWHYDAYLLSGADEWRPGP